MGCEVALAFKG